MLYHADPVTFAEFVDRWLEHYEARVRRSSYERGRSSTSGGWRPKRISRERNSGWRGRGNIISRLAARAPRQAQLALQYLKSVLRNAAERGHPVDPSVFALLPPRHEEREPRFLTWVEVEALASHCSEGRLVVFAALTGDAPRRGLRLHDVALTLTCRAEQRGWSVAPARKS